MPVANIHGELIFDSWNSMFDGDGAPYSNHANIYSFNGKNVLIDATW